MRFDSVLKTLRSSRLLPALGPLFALSCGPEADPDASMRADQGKGDSSLPVVAVSLSPLAGIVDRLLPAGSARIEILVPPGASPHTFEPGMQAMALIQQADVVLELGHPALAWEATWLDGLLAGTDAVRLRLAEECSRIQDDPHVWLDPACLGSAAERTSAVLVALLPGRAADVESRLRVFLERLSEADAANRRLLADRAGSSFAVQHPAWGYFARAYGLEQLAILSHDSGDAGAAHLADVIERMRAENIGTVFVQPQFSREAATTVARETGARIRVLDPLGRDPLQSLVETGAAVAESMAP